MLGIKSSVNHILKNTVESITSRLEQAEKEYQELKTRLNNYYTKTTIKEKINKYDHIFQEFWDTIKRPNPRIMG
jgi:hypothetical protein